MRIHSFADPVWLLDDSPVGALLCTDLQLFASYLQLIAAVFAFLR